MTGRPFVREWQGGIVRGFTVFMGGHAFTPRLELIP